MSCVSNLALREKYTSTPNMLLQSRVSKDNNVATSREAHIESTVINHIGSRFIKEAHYWRDLKCPRNDHIHPVLLEFVQR